MKLTKYIFLMIWLCSIGSSTNIIAYTGVLDRMEGDQAIILIETTNKTLIVNKASLPVDVQMNELLKIEVSDHTYQIISVDHLLTEKRERKSTCLINKLRERTESK